MLGGVAARAESISKGGIRERLNTVWRGDVLPFCRSASSHRETSSLALRTPFAQYVRCSVSSQR